jgi:hypothetical protein
MTALSGRIVKCSNVMWFDLGLWLLALAYDIDEIAQGAKCIPADYLAPRLCLGACGGEALLRPALWSLFSLVQQVSPRRIDNLTI